MTYFLPIVVAAALMLGSPLAVATIELPKSEPLQTIQSRASAGDEKAQMKLAGMYLRGEGVGVDVNRAIHYYRLVAERDIAYAQHRLARLYLDGDPVPVDPVAAERWLARAAHLGFVPAQLDLSLWYENAAGVPRDLVAAYKWVVIAGSLTSANLDPRRERLAAKMNFLQQSQAEMLARLCILGGYQDC